jgi:hypothetical protein
MRQMVQADPQQLAALLRAAFKHGLPGGLQRQLLVLGLSVAKDVMCHRDDAAQAAALVGELGKAPGLRRCPLPCLPCLPPAPCPLPPTMIQYGAVNNVQR